MKIEQIDTGFQIDVGAPTPTILSNEHEVYIIFYIYQPDPSWDGTFVRVRTNNDSGVVTVKLSSFAQYKFGNPNDEAISGHLYYEVGLQPYAIQEVLDSDWIMELRRMNSVHPYHNDKSFSEYRHYIFFFHDTCFEIVCKNFEILQDTQKTLKEEVKRISDLI